MVQHIRNTVRASLLKLLASTLLTCLFVQPLVAREIMPLAGPEPASITANTNLLKATSTHLFAYNAELNSIFESGDGYSWSIMDLDPAEFGGYYFLGNRVFRFNRMNSRIETSSDLINWNNVHEFLRGSFLGILLPQITYQPPAVKPVPGGYFIVNGSTAGSIQLLSLHQPTNPDDPATAVTLSPMLQGMIDFTLTSRGMVVMAKTDAGTNTIYLWQSDNTFKILGTVSTEYTYLTYWPEMDRVIVNTANATGSSHWDLSELVGNTTFRAGIPLFLTKENYPTTNKEKFLCPPPVYTEGDTYLHWNGYSFEHVTDYESFSILKECGVYPGKSVVHGDYSCDGVTWFETPPTGFPNKDYQAIPEVLPPTLLQADGYTASYEPNPVAATYSLTITEQSSGMHWSVDLAAPIDQLVHFNRAFHALGANGNNHTFPTSPEPLSAPTNLTAVTGVDSVALNWNPVPDASGYNVYRQDLRLISDYLNKNKSVLEFVTSITTPSYTDSIILSNIWPMRYIIRAIDASGFPGEATAPCTVEPDFYSAAFLSQLEADNAWNLQFQSDDYTSYYTPLSLLTIAGLDRSIGIATGWAQHSLIGNCYYPVYPWIYSEELGWFAYFSGDDPGNDLFLWSPKDGWLYTWRGGFAFLWSFNEENWIWVDTGASHTRNWYLHQSDDSWVQMPR